MGTVSRLVVAAALALACGCSSNPKPEEPTPPGDGPVTSEPSDEEPTAAAGPAADPGPAPGVVVKRTDDNSVPDDYELMEGDCVRLGKKLGALWRLDLRAKLSPKLTEKQRETGEASIEEAASKKEDDWAEGCIKSLVGKSVDPKALKCAFDSRDLKAFEACLN